MPAPDLRTVAEVLRSAAHYIARHGWYPGHLYDAHDHCTRNCPAHRTGLYPASMVGAIRAALVGAPKWFMQSTPDHVQRNYAEVIDALTDHLCRHGAAGMRAPIRPWSAASCRTPAEVIAALRAAASTAPRTRLHTPHLAVVVDLAGRARPTGDTTNRSGASAALFDLTTRRRTA
ncbi:DUF6197 family protein [Planosporangium sp. 12N6]|uniref:DUF6197 family protein n=1 Tax=Planosporangium spinosum TaxID=3402278 RepID=UPI003CF99E03